LLVDAGLIDFKKRVDVRLPCFRSLLGWLLAGAGCVALRLRFAEVLGMETD